MDRHLVEGSCNCWSRMVLLTRRSLRENAPLRSPLASLAPRTGLGRWRRSSPRPGYAGRLPASVSLAAPWRHPSLVAAASLADPFYCIAGFFSGRNHLWRNALRRFASYLRELSWRFAIDSLRRIAMIVIPAERFRRSDRISQRDANDDCASG